MNFFLSLLFSHKALTGEEPAACTASPISAAETMLLKKRKNKTQSKNRGWFINFQIGLLQFFILIHFCRIRNKSSGSYLYTQNNAHSGITERLQNFVYKLFCNSVNVFMSRCVCVGHVWQKVLCCVGLHPFVFSFIAESDPLHKIICLIWTTATDTMNKI